jgi:CHAD domain-containing protein
MGLRLPADLLDRYADEACRLLALTYLDEIALAERRLSDPQDAEALHDFRVALRRLRSCTRAYRNELKGSVSKRMRRSLRELMLVTNEGRDAEVHLEWLRTQAERVSPEHAEGIAWLVGRMEGRTFERIDTVTEQVSRQFTKVASKFRPRLGTLCIQIRRGSRSERPSFRRVTGDLIRVHAADLQQKLKAVTHADNMEEAHQARIAGKRLRYLLDPIARYSAGVKALTAQLKGLQDGLGHLHDLHVIAAEISSSLETLSRSPAARPPGVEPSLRFLEQLARDQAAAAFARFMTHWGDDRPARFFQRAEVLGRVLTSPGGNAPEGDRGTSPSPARQHEPAPPAAWPVSSQLEANHSEISPDPGSRLLGG